jgi:hypothetical protein
MKMKLCSFCAKEETPDRKFVAGPSVFICSECIHNATELLASTELNGKVSCSVCRHVAPENEFIIFSGKGFLCSDCVRTVRAVTDVSVVK